MDRYISENQKTDCSLSSCRNNYTNWALTHDSSIYYLVTLRDKDFKDEIFWFEGVQDEIDPYSENNVLAIVLAFMQEEKITKQKDWMLLNIQFPTNINYADHFIYNSDLWWFARNFRQANDLYHEIVPMIEDNEPCSKIAPLLTLLEKNPINEAKQKVIDLERLKRFQAFKLKRKTIVP